VSVQANPTIPRARSRGAVGARIAGIVLIAAGVLLLAWAFWIWRWGDPVTGLYTAWQQRKLSSAYESRARDFERATVAAAGPVAVAEQISPATALGRLDRMATKYRSLVGVGDPVGRLAVGRLGLDAVVVEGTTASVLKRGPGRDRRTFMPGQGELVYVAGHRTTYGAPFARIDRLRAGDLVVMTLPYARLRYVVTGKRIVVDDEMSVLRSKGREHLALQACHPRFFATQRYIVDARLASFDLRLQDGETRRFPVSRR
jgi:sortase A